MNTPEQFIRCYREHRFNTKAETTLQQALHILNDMQAQGYILTLRQLYYQFVKRNWIENTEKQYKRLGRIVTNAREAGMMDWLAIEDRGRNAWSMPVQEDPTALINGIVHKLKYDYWARQDFYIEVWVEKQALESVIARPCSKRKVTYMACKGYLSASEAWRAGLRFNAAIKEGRTPILIHLADHDPSGLNMTEDNTSRIRMFAEDYGLQVDRIALNMDQVEHYAPPPNPAKESDSRAAEYVKKFGKHSWELDALDPSVLDALILETVDQYIDWDVWNKTQEEEAEARKPLAAVRDNWDAVKHYLLDNGMMD